jgi:RNA polymerase sigma-54 factor
MKLEQGLKQTLKASLNLQQTINMLQLGSLDIQGLIAQELESNPFLSETELDISNSEKGDVDQEDNEFEYSLRSEIDYEYDYSDSDKSKKYRDSESFDPIANLAAETSLKEFILEQVYTDISDNKERLIAFYLTDMLSDAGYIEEDLCDIAKQLKCSKKIIEKILTQLQKFEPAGVFARNLAECLRIQLLDKKLLNPSYEILLSNLAKIAAKDYFALSKLCKINEQDIRSMISVIKGLNPKPGNTFASNKVIIKIPDVFVKISKDGKITVELNKEIIPHVKVARNYYLETKSRVKNPIERKFLSEKYHCANNFIISLEQRNNAILRVAESLTRLQRSFFEKGILFLNPLTLQEVAKDIGMSESTVSRVTTNKYIACQYGIFELKYLFSGGLKAKTSQDAISNVKVKEIIKKLVELEDKNSAISDENLSRELEKFNIKIARRTVTKYREQLKIPTASQRRRDKIDA